jgi:hypothetical protein
MSGAPVRFIIGCDLGQSADYTAVLAVRRELSGGDGRAHYRVLHMERHRGVPYPEVVGLVRALAARPELRPLVRLPDRPGSPAVRHAPTDLPLLALDATGVGRPVVDMFVADDPPAELVPVTITAGALARRETVRGVRHWFVPKRDLVGCVQALLQCGRLKVAPKLELAGVLKAELLSFKVTVTPAAHETFGAWREAAHDDLCLGLALACWLGEYHGGAGAFVAEDPLAGYAGRAARDVPPYGRRGRREDLAW